MPTSIANDGLGRCVRSEHTFTVKITVITHFAVPISASHWCSQGYTLHAQSNPGTGLQRQVCVPAPPLATWAVALISILAPLAGFILLLAMLIFSNHAWHQIRFKPKYLRRIELSKRRAKGTPKPGEYASVVVTDIEGYSSEFLLLAAGFGMTRSSAVKQSRAYRTL